MQSSAPEVNCRGVPPASGTSQICHGWPAFCLAAIRTVVASGESAASAETSSDGASTRDAPPESTFTTAPAGNRSPPRNTAPESYCGASVYSNALDGAAVPTARPNRDKIATIAEPPLLD